MRASLTSYFETRDQDPGMEPPLLTSSNILAVEVECSTHFMKVQQRG